MNKQEIFTDVFLKEIGFKLISRKNSEFNPFQEYGKAVDVRTNGITTIYWNNGGHSCTYFGDKLEENTSFCVKKDADTRTAFNGYVFNEEDVKRILTLTL